MTNVFSHVKYTMTNEMFSLIYVSTQIYLQVKKWFPFRNMMLGKEFVVISDVLDRHNSAWVESPPSNQAPHSETGLFQEVGSVKKYITTAGDL